MEIEVKITNVNSKAYKQCYGIVCHAYGEDTFIDASFFSDNKNITAEEAADKVS